MDEPPKRLFFVEDDSKSPLMGVGPGAPIRIIGRYFPTAREKIRISSAFFTLSGFKVAQKYIPENIRIWILVGKEDSKNVIKTIIEEIREDLQRVDEDLWQTAYDLLEKLRAGNFKIVDARAMSLPFHTKFYLVDEQILLHGSANFSKRGLCQAIEQLDAVTDLAKVAALSNAFEEYFKLADSLTDELIRVLEDFLRLVSPFDIYLKTLLVLNFLPDRPVRTEGNLPIYYQKAVVARALRQIEQWGGAFVVAATGLGKTVMGAEIALQLQSTMKIKRVILLSPAGNVHDSWVTELEARDIPFTAFTNTVLFRENKNKAGNQQIAELERRLISADENTLILIDEVHIYRNQLLTLVRKGRQSWVIERLNKVVNERGAKIVLLTATPYSTSMLNLNSLLALLPHRMPKGDLFGSLKEWQVRKVPEFGNLQVVTIIGLPHVIQLARQRGDIDENGRVFIQFHKNRRYPPKRLLLTAPGYDLAVKELFQAAWNAGCFDQLKPGMNYVVFDDARTARDATLAQVDYIRNTSLDAWLSSPVALKAAVMKNLNTEDVEEKTGSLWNPDEIGLPTLKITKTKNIAKALSSDDILVDIKPYKVPLKLSRKERMNYLNPLADGLEEIKSDYGLDDKLQQLLQILDERTENRGKAIVFTCLRLTASYLNQALTNLRPSLRVGSTVSGQNLKPVWERQKLQKALAPKANQIPSSEFDLDVLICTDADSMGINLQDADTVVSYDLPREADKVIQRVGRVLRPTDNANRTVYLYVLLPKDLNVLDPEMRSVLSAVEDRFARINRRHDSAQMILNAPVMPNISGKKRKNGPQEINLDREIDVQELLENSQGVLGDLVESMDTSSAIKHQAILEDPQYKERAQKLRDNIFSAMEYPGKDEKIYVLIECREKFFPIIFSVSTLNFENLEDTQLLDLISCSPTTPTPPVQASEIEKLANRVIRKWCKEKQINIDEVRKICSSFLIPVGETPTLLDLLSDIFIEE
jgi:superfamily II DNA or RNA helicase